MTSLKIAIGGLAAIVALVSAGLWFWAANIKVDAADFGAFGGSTENSVKQFAKQARLNSYAAMAMGFSAVFQTISLVLP